MKPDDHPQILILLFIGMALIFALAPLAAAWIWSRRFSPGKPGPQKNATYECGLESTGTTSIQFRAEYYLYAILFLIFDVEVLFLIPFAVQFNQLSGGAVLAMLVFLLLLGEGLAWTWVKGVLRWP